MAIPAVGEEETVEHLLNGNHSITWSPIKAPVSGGSRRRVPAHSIGHANISRTHTRIRRRVFPARNAGRRRHACWFDYLRRHPAAGIPNAYNIPEPPEAVHWDSQLARSVGVPEAYDYGPERIAWLATMLTNWIGDDGHLAELYCEIRRFNLVGDLTHCHGSVEALRERDAASGEVRLKIEAVDQRGDVNAVGWRWSCCRDAMASRAPLDLPLLQY